MEVIPSPSSGKLVRDRIPEIMQAEGESPHTHRVSGEDFVAALLTKVVEEAHEVAMATPDKRAEEIGDMQEVLDALIAKEGLHPEHIAAVRSAKKAKKGGFEDGIILETDATPTHTVFCAIKAVILQEGHFLVLEQQLPGKRIVDLPGGRMEYGETPFETLQREVREETMLEVEVVKPVGIWWFFRVVDGHQVVCPTFLCRIVSGEVNLSQNPTQESVAHFAWVTRKEFLKTYGETCYPSLRSVIEFLEV